MSDATCPTCAEPVIAGDQFCEACGNDLPAEVAGAPRPEQAPTAQDPEVELLGGATSTTRIAAAPCECGGQYEGNWCNTCGGRRPDPRDHQEVDLGIAAVASDKGRRYARNEDAFALEATPDRVLAVICDGVGSTVDPEAASALASEAALAVLRHDPTALVKAHRAADDAVRTHDFTAKPDLGSPSCTFLAASVVGSTVQVASLGDCRAYWLPVDGEAVVVTDDDSWAREQTRGGHMTWDEARADRRANVITRWLGRDADPAWEPEVTTLTIDGPGHLLLCSDGLWNYLPRPEEMAKAVLDIGEDAPPSVIAGALVQHALAAGGHDNVTVVAVPLPLSVPAPSAPLPDDTTPDDTTPDDTTPDDTTPDPDPEATT